MSNRDIKLDRFFSKGEKAVVISMDHGYINGPTKGMINLPETIAKVVPEADAILLSPGMLKNVGSAFSYKGAPMSIVRLNWSPMFYGAWKNEQSYFSQAFSVRDAVMLGADMILVCLVLNTGDDKLDAQNIELFGKIASQARQLGVPVVGEYLCKNFESVSPEELQDAIYRGARIVSEMGADCIKVPYTCNFSEVVDACPVPLLGLGGSKLDTVSDALKLALNIIDDGGKGVVFGRNVLQRENPIEIQKALIAVVKGKMSVEEAVKTFKL